MRIRKITLMTAIGMAVGGMLALASPASATAHTFGALVPSSFVTEYKTADIPLTGVVSVTVPCPAGMAAVSSGGLADGLYSITTGPDQASGVVAARAHNGNTGAPIVASVTCAPTAQFAGTTVATRVQYTRSTNPERTAAVTCPAGMRAFGGGGYFRAKDGSLSTDEFFLGANGPTLDGRGWTVSALDYTVTDALVVTTRCAFQSTSTRLVEEIYPVVPVVPGSNLGRAMGYAHCPDGLLPISGGAVFTQDGSALGSQPELTVSTIVTNGQIGWFASGIDAGEHGRLHVIALCGS